MTKRKLRKSLQIVIGIITFFGIGMAINEQSKTVVTNLIGVIIFITGIFILYKYGDLKKL